MSGTVWPSLVAGAKAKASEVESKFDWMEGDFIPFLAGTQTDATYDLGSASFRWIDGHFSGRIFVGAGSVGAASFSFGTDTDLGLYRGGANDLRVTAGGADSFSFGTTANQSSHPVQVPAGSAAAPTLSFTADSNSGLYNSAADEVAVTCAGTAAWKFESASGFLTAINVSARLYTGDGSLSAPGFSFATESNTGIYRVAADTIGMVTGGVLAAQFDPSGFITQPLQSSFLAYNSATDSNVATGATIDFDTEVYDQNADFAADVFTAPITGRYALHINVECTNLTASAHTAITMRIVTSNRTYSTLIGDSALALENYTFTLSIIADMDTSDTATVTISFTGGSNDIDIIGSSVTLGTTFSGSLIN